MSQADTRDVFWQTKLHARLHDPAEKALVLLRDPAGHEGGTSEVLHRLLGFQRLAADLIDPDNADALHTVLFKNGIPRRMYETVRRADWWAAAADRPQWPMDEIEVTTRSGERRTLEVADWAQVRWTKEPKLIHPLTGDTFDLKELGSTELEDIKSRSFQHFAHLVVRGTDGEPELVRTLLAYWRFGPELSEEDGAGKLGALWPLLPADTRVPDHSIWDHLDLTSAFAGAFADDPEGEAALLALSIGPVQEFIEAARSTSDLWAGSHLLSRLAWEAMKPVCEALGPDAILFPKLRSVPQVDLWLRDDCGLPREWFADCEWAGGSSDANPLFSAALPNRFVAIVPRSRARELALQVERAVRGWLDALGQRVVDRLLQVADIRSDGPSHAHRQMREQLRGFPEVHWAAVPFSLIRRGNAERDTNLDTTELSAAMEPFFGVARGHPCGFLASPAWQVLTRDLRCDGSVFFEPNPGALYAAVHDLAERAHAAAKATRSFEQTAHQGWRCSLTGETEWLATDLEQLRLPPGQRTDTLWARVAERRPAWARPGEHLGALPAVKRLWPTLFAEEVGAALGADVRRFVVSTHTMALAHQIEQALQQNLGADPTLAALIERHRKALDPAALPRKLARSIRGWPLADHVRDLPALLDLAAEDEDPAEAERTDIERAVKRALGAGRLETYYGLLLLDGDRMGAWLAGGESYAIRYRESFHPAVRVGFDRKAAASAVLQAYGQQRRALSPNRHLAISGALNDYSLHVVRHIVEDEHLGRVIYAGGDDVLAMLPVADLLPAMQRLRCAYSGDDPSHREGDRDGLVMRSGFVRLDGRLMRMMGARATASCGAVVAHHQAPLAAVLRELRAAEQRAKAAGRDAFSLSVVKRSGGALRLTAKWDEPVAVLNALIAFLREPGVSRRAVYNALDWMKDLPADLGAPALAKLLAHQWARQADDAARQRHPLPSLAERVAALTAAREAPLAWLHDFLGVAEFLARETRAPA